MVFNVGQREYPLCRGSLKPLVSPAKTVKVHQLGTHSRYSDVADAVNFVLREIFPNALPFLFCWTLRWLFSRHQRRERKVTRMLTLSKKNEKKGERKELEFWTTNVLQMS